MAQLENRCTKVGVWLGVFVCNVYAVQSPEYYSTFEATLFVVMASLVGAAIGAACGLMAASLIEATVSWISYLNKSYWLQRLQWWREDRRRIKER